MADKKPLSLFQRLQAVRTALEAANRMVGFRERPPQELLALCMRLQEALAILNAALEASGKLDRDLLNRCTHGMDEAFRTYRDYYEHLPRAKKSIEAPFYKAVSAAAGGFLLPETGAAAELSSLLTTIGQEREAYNADLGSSLLTNLPEKFSMTGTPVGIRDMMTANVETGDPERIFGILLWLGMNEARIRRDNLISPEALEQNPFHRQYVLLVNSLNNAPAPVRLRYLHMMNRQRIMNQDNLASEYQEIRSRVPDETQARKELMGRDSFRHAQSYDEMCRRLPGPMGLLLRQTAEAEEGSNALSTISNRHPEVNALLNAQPDPETAQLQRQNAIREVSSDYLKTELASKAFELCSRMDQDQEPQSDTCRAMYRMLSFFAREDHGTIANDNRYLKRLTACERAARLYLQTHRPKPHSEDGKKRVQLAKDIQSFCLTARAEFDRKLRSRDSTQVNDLIQKENKTLDDLERIAQYQSYGAVANINPRIRDMNPPKRWYQWLWGGTRHLLASAYTGLAALTTGAVGNTLGILAGAYVYGIQRTRATWRRKPQALDLDHVPGERDAALQDTLHTRKDPNTGILTDVRRVPMAWEREIPDDPDKPPTVSFRAQQPRLGMPQDEAPDGSGHCYICLRYSKVDPRTGKLQRYETSYGFFPKGGFINNRTTAAMVQVGFRVPGQLNSDHDSPYSVERSMIVGSNEINRLLIFAQNYEKGGYNLVTRNCTTFLAESAKFAGIDLGISKVDIATSSAKTRLGAALAPLAGNIALSVAADEQVLEKLNRDDMSYQRFGQKMVSKEDFRRETNMSFNQRLRGYTPGAAGQAFFASPTFTIRNADGRLHDAMQIKVRMEIMQLLIKPDEKETDRYLLDGYTASGPDVEKTNQYMQAHPLITGWIGLRQQILPINNSLETILRGKSGDQASVREALNDFSAYNQTVLEALEKAVFEIENEDAPNPKEALARTSRMLGDYLSGLDRYFRVSFQSDADLLPSFQQLALAALELKSKVEVKYRAANNAEIAKEIFTSDPVNRMRDTALIQRDFIQDTRLEVRPRGFDKTLYIPPAGLLAMGRVYKNAEEVSNDEEAVRAGSSPHATVAQKKAKAAADRRAELASDVADTYKYFTAQKQFNNSDINLLFNTLPKLWAGPVGSLARDPVRQLQCYALEHVFGGLSKSLGTDPERRIKELWALRRPTPEMQELEQQAAKLQAELKKLPPAQRKGNPIKARLERIQGELAEAQAERNAAFQEACTSYVQQTTDRMARNINKTLRELNPEQKLYLRTMQICIAQRMLSQDQQDERDSRATTRDYAALAANELMNTLAGTYCGNLMNGAMERLCNGRTSLMPTAQCPMDTNRLRRGFRIPDFLMAPITGLNQKGPNPSLPPVQSERPAPGAQRT